MEIYGWAVQILELLCDVEQVKISPITNMRL